MYGDQITFRCAKCGSKKFDIPANPKPNDMIACERGHAMKFANAQKQAVDLSKKIAEKTVRNSFRKK